MLLTRLSPLILVIAALVLASCSRKAPLDEVVVARTQSVYTFWTSDAAKFLSKSEMRLFEAAIQELKFEIMERGERSADGDAFAPLKARIDGKTVREVLTAGFSYRSDRLERERAELAAVLARNARLVPADDASRQHLERTLAGQRTRLEKLEADLSEARGVLALTKP